MRSFPATLLRHASASIAAVVLCAALLAVRAHAQDGSPEALPIVFVHGNGDSAAVWTEVEWRFESNDYPSDRLFAVDLRFPTARDADDVPQPGTSSTTDVRDQLAAFVAEVRARTGAAKVVLVGSSRGANTIRNYLKNAGGAAVTARAVLCGGPSHGVFRIPFVRTTSEFNGAGPFIEQLNAGPSEVVPGVDTLTIRSDYFDKYAQPWGTFIGYPWIPTFVSYDTPELAGAVNVVLPGIDHRETATGPEAFAAMYAFITGHPPATLEIVPEPRPVLNGRVTGVTADLFDNRPVPGAVVTIFEVDGQTGARRGGPQLQVTTSADGRWGPFTADPGAEYEFVVEAPGLPVTHIYRSGFARSSNVVDLRPALPFQEQPAGSTVVLSRPTGYFGIKDRLLFDGKRPDMSTDPVPNVDRLTLTLPARQRSHLAEFADETIALQTWPVGEAAIVEFMR